MLRLTSDVSESDVSLTVIYLLSLRLFLRNIGVGNCGEATCGADGPAMLGLFGGAASGIGGLK